MPRIVFLDIAKAMCMILVVVGHYYPATAPEYWHQLIAAIYTFHMPLFMFISGYVYMATGGTRNDSYGTFVAKKARRLALPYLTVSILLITVKLTLNAGVGGLDNPCTPYSYVEMWYKPAAGYFLWFLYVLYLIFLIVPLFKTARSRHYLVIASLLFYFVPIELPEIFCMHAFKNHFCYFMFGVLCGERGILARLSVKMRPTLPLVLLAVNVCIAILGYAKTKGIDMLLAVNGIYCILQLSRYIEHRQPGALRAVAASSFIIYLFHTSFEGFTKMIVYKITAFVPLPFIVVALIVVAGGILLPMLLDRLLVRRSRPMRILLGVQ